MWGKSKGHSGKEDGSRMESEGGKPRLVIVGGGWGVSEYFSFFWVGFGWEGERREGGGEVERVREDARREEEEFELTFSLSLPSFFCSLLDS